MTAATTMSRVRQCVSGTVVGVVAPIVVIRPNLLEQVHQNVTEPRDGVLERCWPASFAGTSRIRFGGSVAIATLSALDALPGGGVRLYPERSTLSQPGDHVVDHVEALRLVVELVAEARVGPAFDTRCAFEDLAGRRRDEAVVEAVEHERRPTDRSRVRTDALHLAKGL